MKNFLRICIAKTGWSSNYQGANVYGRHDYVQRTKDGHERFNFLPGPDGQFYVYIPPNRGGHVIPDPDDGWLILIVAAETHNQGRSFRPLRVIGWFEEATFVPQFIRPEYLHDRTFPTMESGEKYTYTAKAKRAFLIPERERNVGLPLQHGRKLGSAPSILVRGPSADPTLGWKADYASFAENFVQARRPFTPMAAESAESEAFGAELGMLGRFGWPTHAHRVRVEKAAEELAEAYFQATHQVKDVTKENRGYDFHLTNWRDRTEILLEVKGTSGDRQAFFMTQNEHRTMRRSDNFRLFLATSVLSEHPQVHVFTSAELDRFFDLEPLSFCATKKP